MYPIVFQANNIVFIGSEGEMRRSGDKSR